MEGKFSCKYCNKKYSSSQSRSNHYKKDHKIESKSKLDEKIKTENKDKQLPKNQLKNFDCRVCCKLFSCKQSRWKHEQTCKKIVKKINIEEENINKFNFLEKEINNLKEIIKKNEIQKIEKPVLNNDLINLIIDKSKKIQELTNKMQDKDSNIFYRMEDNYINATKLCETDNKTFEDWIQLETTKEIIKYIESNTLLIELINNENWIHPELAINLAHWVSPMCGLKMNDFIKKKLNKEKEIQNEKIELLENSFNKKQKRKQFPLNNYIYMLTNEPNKNKRIYVIGKTTNLTQRMSGYNKSNEHEIVYYKECESKDDMTLIELMVLNKLKNYKEKANRDRFILPIGKDISYFKKIIDNCVNFISSNEIII